MQKKRLDKIFIMLVMSLAAQVLFLHYPASAGRCGVDWQLADPLPEEILGVHKVTFGEGQFVATAGYPGGFLISPDGFDWTWITLFGTQTYYGIVWGENQFVAVKNQDYTNPVVRTSPDGITWTGYNPGILGGLTLLDVIWKGDKYVAVGGEDALSLVAISEDGKNWTSNIGQVGKLKGVAWNGKQLVAVGESPYISGSQIPAPILTSSDGSAWISQDAGTTQDLNDVAWGGGQFVAVGNGSLADTGINAVILTSFDGVEWTWRDSGTTDDLLSVAYGANQFVAVGNFGTILTSSDGITWTAQNSDTDNRLNNVAWAEDRFVAVGEDIVVSTCDTYPGDVDADGDSDTPNNGTDSGGGGGGGCFLSTIH